MKKLYYMSCSELPKAACAVGPKGHPLIWDLATEMENTGKCPFDLTLWNVVFKNGESKYSDDFSQLKIIWSDCLLNSELLFLCSEKLKAVIDESLEGTEGVKWISCNVKWKEDVRTYFFPLFTEELDVMDENGRIDDEKIERYTMFTISRRFNWRIPNSIYISGKLRQNIIRAGLKKGIYLGQAGAIY